MSDIARPSKHCNITLFHGDITNGGRLISLDTKCSVSSGFTYVLHPDGEEVFVCGTSIHIKRLEDAEALANAFAEIVKQARAQQPKLQDAAE